MSDNIDLSAAIEQLQGMLSTEEGQNNLQSLIGQFTGGGEPEPSSDENGGGGFDPGNIEMMAKLQSVMAAMNRQGNSADAQFLHALRPYLKESRRAKLDQAVKLLGMAQVFKLMQGNESEGGLL